jgi:hypothetical protein
MLTIAPTLTRTDHLLLSIHDGLSVASKDGKRSHYLGRWTDPVIREKVERHWPEEVEEIERWLETASGIYAGEQTEWRAEYMGTRGVNA